MHEIPFNNFSSEENKHFTKKEIVVTPGIGRAVGLGLYVNGTSEPDFTLTFRPDMEDEMGIALSRLEIPEKRQFLMMLQLHNFGSKPCTVTVKRARRR